MHEQYSFLQEPGSFLQELGSFWQDTTFLRQDFDRGIENYLLDFCTLLCHFPTQLDHLYLIQALGLLVEAQVQGFQLKKKNDSGVHEQYSFLQEPGSFWQDTAFFR